MPHSSSERARTHREPPAAVYTRAPARERRKGDEFAVTGPVRVADGGRGAPGIDRPIFVIGTGRSGTTLFFQMLGFHPDLAWFSTYGNYLYKRNWPALLSRVRDVPGIDRLLRPDARFTPKPA